MSASSLRIDDMTLIVRDFERRMRIMEGRSTGTLAAVPHTSGVRRLMANVNGFTNQTSYVDFPNATDKAAMEFTFTKHRDDTKLVLRANGTCEFGSGAGQRCHLGIAVGSTTYDVAMFRPAGAVVRFTIVGSTEVNGVPAGSYTVKPQFKTDTTAVCTFYNFDDFVSFSIEETY